MFLPNRHSIRLRLVLMAGAAVLFLLGYQWGNRYQHRHAEPPAIAGVLVRPPLAVPGFSLSDPRGRVFDAEALAAGWTLLGFGDLAGASGQLAIARLIDVYNRVADREGLQRNLRLALVSEGDLPELARDFAALSPALYVLGGDPGEVGRLRAALGADGEAPAAGGAAALGPDSTPLFVFAPGGRLVAVLPRAADPAAMAADLKALHRAERLLSADLGSDADADTRADRP